MRLPKFTSALGKSLTGIHLCKLSKTPTCDSLIWCKQQATTSKYFLPPAVVSTGTEPGRFYPERRAAIRICNLRDSLLLKLDVKDPELRKSPIPIGNHAIED
jgi:hypothetical protein